MPELIKELKGTKIAIFDLDGVIYRGKDLIHNVDKNIPSKYSFVHTDDISLFIINREDMVSFAARNPGLVMKLKLDFD